MKQYDSTNIAPALKDKDNEVFLSMEAKVIMSKEEVIEILKTLEGLKRKLQPFVKS